MSKKIFFLIEILLISIACSGCKSNLLPGAREIDQFEMVQVVGIDRSKQNPNEVEVTVISKMHRGTQGKGGAESQEISSMSSTGPNVFDAERKIKAHSDKMIFFGHVDYFIIGEAAAKEDLGKYFDFVNRDHEIRLSPKVYIAKNCTAKEFIENTSTGSKFVADRLDNMKFDISILSNIDQVRIIDISAMLDNKDAATIIPALECIDVKDEKSTEDLPKKDITIGGYAIIKDFKLAGYIEEPYSRGYNFLVNKIKSCVVSVKDQSGQLVGLEVIKSNTKVEAHFNGDQLEGVTYKTHVTSNIQEQHSREDIYKEDILKDLAAQQSASIRDQMEQVISVSKKYETDCTTLGEQIRMQHPYKWEKIKDNWKEIYPTLKIEIEVESQIARTYDIREPNGYQEGS